MKKIVYAIAFLGMGTFAMAQQNKMPPMRDAEEMKMMKERKKAEHMAQMEKDLNLTKAQVAQLNAIQDKYQANRTQERLRNQELRKQKMEAYKLEKQQMDNEIRGVLSAEQYTKWEAKKKMAMQKKHDNMQMKRKKLLETSKDRKWGQTMDPKIGNPMK